MAGSTISITFALKGDAKGFEELAKSSKTLESALSAANVEAGKFNTKLINTKALNSAFYNLQSSINTVKNAVGGLVDAYGIQEAAEAKLAEVMRQRMNAGADEVQAIKDLASEQQKLGVIGDEVQLAGAQMVATFLSQTDSISTLLPAMNNLIAQQAGLNATQSDAESVAKMMGKAMQGQVTALSRAGITFSEAEAEVMKFGTEEERAAMLAQIITNNVGDMNAALAKTSSGKQKQLANTIGDIKEQLGKIVQPAAPFLSMAAGAISAITTMGRLVTSVKALTGAFKALSVAIKANPIGLIIGLVSTAIAVFALWRNKVDDANAAIKAGQQTYNETAAALEAYKIKIQAVQKEKGDETKLVEELNSTYGDAMGHYSTLAQWYDVLTAKGEQYCQMLANQARMQVYASQLAELQAKRDEAAEVMESYKDQAATPSTNRVITSGGGAGVTAAAVIGKSEYQIAKEEVDELDKKIEEIKSKAAKLDLTMGSSTAGTKATAAPTKSETGTGKATSAAAQYRAEASTIAEISENIAYLTEKKRNAHEEDIAAITEEITAWEQEKARLEAIGGTVEDNTKQWNAEALSINDINDNISILRDRLNEVEDLDEAARINEEIKAWEAKAEAVRNAGNAAVQWNAEARSINDINDNIGILRDRLNEVESLDEAARINDEIKAWEAKAEAIQNATNEVERNIEVGRELESGYEGIKGVKSSIDGITESLKGSGDAWDTVTGIVDGFIAIYKNLATVVNIIELLTAVSDAHAVAKTTEAVAVTASTTATVVDAATSATATAEAIPEVVATKALTQAYTQLAAARYLAAHASIPFVGFATGSAFVASATALVQSVGAMPFAEGGIVSGKTLALVGEYAGAQNNPEVIAPLDKLRGLLGGSGGGTVDFKLQGRKLVGVLANETRITSKAGRRSKIVV